MSGQKEAAEAVGCGDASVGEHTLCEEAVPGGAVERSVRQM